MLPVYKSIGSTNDWKRVQGPSHNIVVNELAKKLQFSWSHTFNENDGLTYFAYTYPWSCADSDKFIDKVFIDHAANPHLYLHREELIRSPEGRKLEIITLTSTVGKTDQQERSLPYLFPEENRPLKFENKKYIFVSCRVHPGEVPASYMLNGIFRYLLSNSKSDITENNIDPRVSIILDNFVFVIIPILNPDGVYRGHYRMNTFGQNLNRYYQAPTLEKEPSNFAVNGVLED
jgi:murein tripeptide amidase MpaA